MNTRTAILALSALAGIAHADTVYWHAGPDTQWTNPANWIGHVPNSNDFVVIQPGPGPQLTGIKTISGLFVQPGGGMVLLGELNVRGGASIQGNVSIAGAQGRFTHRDDVNLEGTITMWDGALIERSSSGNGVFSVRASGSIVIPTYDTTGVTIGTYLQVFGQLRHESTHTLHVGQFYLSDASSSYIAIQSTGTMTFTRGGDVARTFQPAQSTPYIANDGVIDIQGALIDVVDISSEVAVINGGYLYVNQPDLHIRLSWDITPDGILTRGHWTCQNNARVYFDGNSLIHTIGPGVSVALWEGGSFFSLNDLRENNGSITVYDHAFLHTSPQSGYFTNHGSIDLGDNVTLAVDGQFYNASNGTLSCWIAGPASSQHGHIEAVTAALAGTLNAKIEYQYKPAKGETITMVQAENFLSGQFSTVNTLYTSLPFDNQYDFVSMSLVAGCPADFNHDGAVDFFDYDDFVACFEGTVCPPGKYADFNSDTSVDFFDYDDFVNAFETPC